MTKYFLQNNNILNSKCFIVVVAARSCVWKKKIPFYLLCDSNSTMTTMCKSYHPDDNISFSSYNYYDVIGLGYKLSLCNHDGVFIFKTFFVVTLININSLTQTMVEKWSGMKIINKLVSRCVHCSYNNLRSKNEIINYKKTLSFSFFIVESLIAVWTPSPRLPRHFI